MVRGADVPQALSHYTLLSATITSTTRHTEAFQVTPPRSHTSTVCSLTSDTQQGHLWRPSQRPRLSSAECSADLSAHYARLPVTNTHYCCPSQQEKKESGERYLKWSRKTNEPYFSSALLCLVCRQGDTHGSEILGPLFLLLCIASALIGGRSSCAHSHLVSAAAAAASSSISTPPREDSSLAPP